MAVTKRSRRQRLAMLAIGVGCSLLGLAAPSAVESVKNRRAEDLARDALRIDGSIPVVEVRAEVMYTRVMFDRCFADVEPNVPRVRGYCWLDRSNPNWCSVRPADIVDAVSLADAIERGTGPAAMHMKPHLAVFRATRNHLRAGLPGRELWLKEALCRDVNAAMETQWLGARSPCPMSQCTPEEQATAAAKGLAGVRGFRNRSQLETEFPGLVRHAPVERPKLSPAECERMASDFLVRIGVRVPDGYVKVPRSNGIEYREFRDGLEGFSNVTVSVDDVSAMVTGWWFDVIPITAPTQPVVSKAQAMAMAVKLLPAECSLNGPGSASLDLDLYRPDDRATKYRQRLVWSIRYDMDGFSPECGLEDPGDMPRCMAMSVTLDALTGKTLKRNLMFSGWPRAGTVPAAEAKPERFIPELKRDADAAASKVF